MSQAGRRIQVQGVVQGVGFRPWVYRLAREEGVAGHVRNGGAGVTIEAFGPPQALDAFLARLQASPPPAASIRNLSWERIESRAVTGFEIVPSSSAGERRPSIPADLATCPDCLAEVNDPGDRRYRYPFANCTACGPRFTIATDVPYDRPATTMAPFEMCPDCRREYEDPADRRFHAQPIACPTCGPRLRLCDEAGLPVRGRDPLQVAVAALRAGLVVAIKGLGGYHLACDATSDEAVARLRSRKRRAAKPFAVMVANVESAAALALLSPAEAAALAAPARPIVLAPLRPRHPLAPGVAPGLDLVGLLLPYTPLHHLLLAEVGAPLVMTSGNLAEEPIAWRDEEAVGRLGGIADLLLLHDREVAAPCEDSVVRTVAGSPTILRRSRGFVPMAIPVARPFTRPVLAIGGDLKSVACLGVGDSAWLTPHVGDLASPEALDALALAVDRVQRFVGTRAELVACDPHPGYFSRRIGRDLARELACGEPIAVQHHHAHVASCLAEHGLAGPVLGVAFDGTGWGLDGTAWGGELLLADLIGFRRLATLRPMRLAGGDTALRECWRLALAVLDDAFEGQPPLAALELFRGLDPVRVVAVGNQLRAGVNTPLAHGAGRWFDAAGAVVLGVATAQYEGEAALRLERAAAAVGGVAVPYAFELSTGAEPWEVDLRPTVRALVHDLRAGRSPNAAAARFHATLAAAVEGVVRRARRLFGPLPVALSGGCFQNTLLVEGIATRLADVRLLRHRLVPPGDGGLALGQAVVAAALDEERRREVDELEHAWTPEGRGQAPPLRPETMARDGGDPHSGVGAGLVPALCSAGESSD